MPHLGCPRGAGLIGAALSLMLLIGCGEVSTDLVPEVESSELPATSPAPPTRWELVASFGNPMVWDEGAKAEEVISRALGAAQIEWGAVGSANFSVSVPAADAERARAIIRAVVARDGVSAHVIEAEDVVDSPSDDQ